MNSIHFSSFIQFSYISRRSLHHCFLLVGLLSLANFAAAAPEAMDDTRTVPANTSITLDPLINDSSPEGLTLTLVDVGEPGHGTAELNPDGSVFYTPAQNFAGTDSFPYTIQDSQGERAIALITIHVTQRQLQTFADDENSANLASVLQDLCERLQQASDAELGAARSNLKAHCDNLRFLAESDPDQLNRVLNQIAPEETITQMRIAVDANRSQTGAVSQRLQQLRSGSNAFTLNGIALNAGTNSGGGAGDELISRAGIFASIQYDSAKRKITDLENGYDYDASSATFGADYRLSNTSIVGMAVGFTQNELEFKQQDGDLETDITSFIFFGSQQWGQIALDAQLGYGFTAFSSQRNIFYQAGDVTMNEVLRGSTEGDQWMFHSQVQWEWNRQALNVYPFARVDYLQNDTKSYAEQGNSGLAMEFSEQSVRQVTLGAGFQATYALSQQWGVLVPTMEVSANRDMRFELNPVTARFAYDAEMDNAFQLSYDNREQTYFEVGVGASAVFKGGLSAFFQYQQLLGYDDLSAYQIQAGVRYEL